MVMMLVFYQNRTERHMRAQSLASAEEAAAELRSHTRQVEAASAAAYATQAEAASTAREQQERLGTQVSDLQMQLKEAQRCAVCVWGGMLGMVMGLVFIAQQSFFCRLVLRTQHSCLQVE
jgi:hypothetical protein